MKRTAFIFGIFFAIIISALSLSAAAASPIDGTYEGWYYANQGQTGLTLTVKDGVGTFEFFNMPGKSNAKDGSYEIEAKLLEDGEYQITGTKWIVRPTYYNFVTLKGTLENDTYSGYVDGKTSWPFMLKKNNSSYEAVSSSVFQNHKYEIINEGVTWEEAYDLCEKTGGHLVTVTSAEEQKFIESLIKANGTKDQYWMGAIVISGEGEWITGEEFSYSNWDKGEPNNNSRKDGEEEIYLQIFNKPNPYRNGSKQYCWNDIYVDNTFPGEEKFFSLVHIGYICEWETWSESAEWATEEMVKAEEKGLIPDVLVGKDMTKPITRGEFAAVAVKLFESITGGRAVMSSECGFTDIDENENRNYILKAYNIGAVNGISETEYRPDELISREQLATMLTRVFKRYSDPEWTLENDANYKLDYAGVSLFADDADISDYARASVYFMVKNKIISGVGNNMFAPKNTTENHIAIGYANATREQALVMSLRAFDNLK